MPVYDFRCPSCGPFEERRPMVAASDAATCGTCGGDAARLYRSPAIGMRSAAAVADAVDDRSRHDPARVRGVPGHGSAGHAHDHGPSRPWQIAH